MTDHPHKQGAWQVEGADAWESVDAGTWQQKRDAIRNIIRAEVDRAHPIDDARRSIELIAETSIRSVERDGRLELLVVDDDRRPRTIDENGTVRDFTVRDLIQELRVKHPKLFQQSQATEDLPLAGASLVESNRRETDSLRPSPVPDAGHAPQAVASAPEPFRAAPRDRDWLDLGSSPAVSPRDALTTKLRSLERARQQPYQGPRMDETRSPFDELGLDNHDKVGVERASRQQPYQGPRIDETRSPFDDLRLDGNDQAGVERASRLEAARDLAMGVRETFSERRPGLVTVLAGILFLIVIPYLVYLAFVARSADDKPVETAAATATAPVPEFNETSSIQTRERPEPAKVEAGSTAPGPLQGVPEVLDTATLFLQGRIVPLFGVEWVRGAGSPEDLTRYLNGREVVCHEASSPGTYRCEADTQDLSKVVLYNGGGRAKPDATPELKAAENAARSARRGVWASNVGGGQ